MADVEGYPYKYDWEKLWETPEPVRTNGATNGATPTTAITGEHEHYVSSALAAEAQNVATAQPGTRNDTLNIATFNLAQLVPNGYLDDDTIETALTDAATLAGLPAHEIRATIASGLIGGKKHPRVIADNPEPYAPPVTVMPPPPADELDAFWAARPLLAHVHTFARARRVSPWAVLGVTLARIVTAVEPFVVLPPIVGAPASLNLFVGLVGASGAGKGAAEGVARDAVTLGTHLEVATTGSGEGIAHAFMRRTKGGDIDQHTTAVLFSVPEIDTLAALGDRRGATLMPELRRAWSGERLGFAYADPGKRLPVPAHKYRLCLVAGIQPTRAGALLDDVDGGTPQRWLWLTAEDPDAPDVPPAEPEPYQWRPPRPRVTVDPSGHTPLTVTETARKAIDAARLERLRGGTDVLDAHALLARLKVAAAFALADRRLDVSDADWELADVVSRVSAATRSKVVAALAAKVADTAKARAIGEAERAVVVSERVEDAAVKRVCRVITRKLSGAAAVPRSDLRRAVTSRDRRYFEEAFDRLLDAGQIVVEPYADGDRVRAAERPG